LRGQVLIYNFDRDPRWGVGFHWLIFTITQSFRHPFFSTVRTEANKILTLHPLSIIKKDFYFRAQNFMLNNNNNNNNNQQRQSIIKPKQAPPLTTPSTLLC
jgi:hypothetical protein